MPLSNKLESELDPSKPATRCRRRAMDILAQRDHSRVELERKLVSRGFEAELVRNVLEDLVRDRLLEDRRFVESFISKRVRKGQGPVRIRGELIQRGIPEADVATSLALVDLDWTTLAADVRAKRFGEQRPTGFRERARQAKFLQYRGFEPDQIRAALDMVAD